MLIVEFGCAALRDQSGGDVKRKKVLEFDIAGAVERAGRGEVNGTDSPQAKSEDDGLRAKAARSKPLLKRTSLRIQAKAVITGRARRS